MSKNYIVKKKKNLEKKKYNNVITTSAGYTADVVRPGVDILINHCESGDNHCTACKVIYK